jgi:hypothetical protein
MGQYIGYIPNDDLEYIQLSYNYTVYLPSYGRIMFVVCSPVRRLEYEKKRKEFQQEINTVFLCINSSNSNREWISYPKPPRCEIP